MTLAEKITAYFEAKNYVLRRELDAVNILYIEGADQHGNAITDTPDAWNDRRIILQFDGEGVPFISLNAAATCEPGTSATLSPQAAKRGGVARVMFGQFKVWRMGFHKGIKIHPALVQRAPLMVHRDRNRDQKRTGDPVSRAMGINQHGTREGHLPERVGNWSEGCPVGLIWAGHLTFIEICKHDPEYLKDPNYLFYTAFIPGDEFARFNPNLNA